MEKLEAIGMQCTKYRVVESNPDHFYIEANFGNGLWHMITSCITDFESAKRIADQMHQDDLAIFNKPKPIVRYTTS